MADTSGIHKVVTRARRRLKLQSAFETATLFVVASSACALVVVFSTRVGWIDQSLALPLLLAAVGLVLVGGLIGYLRSFSTALVATRVDRASGLSDRLASACAFESQLAAGAQESDSETLAMMRLAIEDAVAAVPKANVKAATPFSMPRDAAAAGVFALVSALVAGIYFQPDVHRPMVAQCEPGSGLRGAIVKLSGNHLVDGSGGLSTEVFLEPSQALLTAQGEQAGAATEGGQPPAPISVRILSAQKRAIEIEVPVDAPIGWTELTVAVDNDRSEPIRFEVLHEDDPRAKPVDHIVLEEEDLDYTKDLVAELRETARATEDLELEQLANELETLLDKAKNGEINKKELLEALAKAEEQYMKGSEEALAEAVSDLKQAGKELKQSPETRELGQALEQGNLDQAKQELEKLADKLEQGKLSDQAEKKLAEAMEKAADKMAKAEEKRQQAADKKIQKQQEAIRKLEKKQQQAKNKEQQEEIVRRLNKEQRELKRLQREKEQSEQDENKRQLKQLRRNMQEAAKQLRQKPEQQQQRQQSRRQVSKSMRDMARSAGKVSQDQRKMANRRQVTSQMSDLKEAMRRARRQGSEGAKNRFGRNKRNRDFGSRARGGQGQKGAWKPGQGQQGQGQQGQGQQGQGNQPGGQGYGEGHDPNLMGDPTAKSGNTKDESMQGVHGKGPSTRETILTAAQKGFANRSYKDVYVRYKTVVEEVIKSEKVPSGYKYYVKRYFQKIKPHEM